MHFPHTATIQAMTKTGTKYEFGTTGTTECFLQPLDPEYSAKVGIDMTKGFACYVPITSEIAEKSRLVIDGDTYGVSGELPRPYGNIAHRKLILERQ